MEWYARDGKAGVASHLFLLLIERLIDRCALRGERERQADEMEYKAFS